MTPYSTSSNGRKDMGYIKLKYNYDFQEWMWLGESYEQIILDSTRTKKFL